MTIDRRLLYEVPGEVLLELRELRADAERLREAIIDHRREILLDGESKFDVNEADERLWALLPPASDSRRS